MTSYYIWAAIAQHDGRDAGHICYGWTKSEARTKARAKTSRSFVIRREKASSESVAALEAAGKLSQTDDRQIREVMAHLGRQGRGAAKRRGDADYYRRLRALRKDR